jgi:PAS domain S-box-containing protein
MPPLTTRNDSRRRWYVSELLGVAALATTYFVAAKFSLSMGAVGGVAAPVWPPTGLSLAALILFGPRFWPGVAVGAFLANWSVGVPALAAVGMGCGNTLEALVGSYLLRRANLRPALERLRDVLSLIVLGAGLSTLVSATIGVTSGWLGGVIRSADYATAWWTWWVGDAMGDLVVASALLIWSAPPPLSRQVARYVEAGVFGITLVVVALLAFRGGGRVGGDQYLRAYVVFPFVIWAARRFGQPGVAVTIVVVSVLAIWTTVDGFGPFVRTSAYESLLFLQTFMGIVAATALVLGAAITEHRRAETALRESEERHRRLIEISPDGVMLASRDGTILLCNEQAAVLHGCTRAELTGRNAFDLLAASDRPRAWEDLRKMVETGSVHNVEYTLRKSDGTALPVEVSTSVLLERDGQPQGFIAIERDISARKLGQERMAQLLRDSAEAESRFRALFDSAPTGILTVDVAGTIVFVNAQLERMLGYGYAELKGKPVEFVVPERFRNRHSAHRAGFAADPQMRPMGSGRDLAARRKDGSEFPVEIGLSPVRTREGLLIAAHVSDISDRKALEQLRADFVASLTHDIRGPVGNIGGYLELLRDEPGLSPQARQIIAVMESSVETTFSLITNYLDRARIEAGRLLLTKGPVALNELLIRVVRQYEVVGARRGITVALQLQPALPFVDGDALALERVFANLVHNALKFTPHGGRITISTRQEDRSVAVSVTDTGPGIPAEDIPSLFQRYRQTATGRSQLGTGLGLFIAKALVEAHGGKIRVSSDGEGSCFSVLLTSKCTDDEASRS